jgi:uncharacterized membrane protein YoaK (UPF0700 family)
MPMTIAVQTFRRLSRLVFDEADGPLPIFLVGLTILTGMVDALSFLRLGEVFVANMTGNIVLLGFDVAGVSGFSAPVHLAALAAFILGAAIGGRLGTAFGHHRGRLVAVVAASKCGFACAAVCLSLLLAQPDAPGFRYALIGLLSTSMGLQNAAVRRLRIPDLTTTVLTGTITALGSDLLVAGANTGQLMRRVLSALLLLIGAAAGAAILKLAGITALLLLNLLLLACVAAGAARLWSSHEPWTR